ncbi:MAG TPA: NAD(+) diphosphatase [Capillimicrobium sp.]|nr:NAD(+) diphosphatase [Capillimicrobium sp.]
MNAVPNTFAGAALDRVSTRRGDADWVARAAADPAARALVTVGGELVLGAGAAPLEAPVAAVAPLDGTEPVLLGLRDGHALFAIEAAAAPDGGRLASLREVAPALSQAEGATIAYATALGNWHRTHRFCAACGAPTEVREAGFQRVCPACGAHHFPRTDPVVIMLVADPAADRVLLGRQAAWPPGRYSCLAGFVEPGEALEEAVAREVAEEADVAVDEVRYRSSQPWPFPASLMLGFTCRYAGGEPRVVDGELEDVRWFPRAELVAGDAVLPPPHAIARRLIDDWLEEDPA